MIHLNFTYLVSTCQVFSQSQLILASLLLCQVFNQSRLTWTLPLTNFLLDFQLPSVRWIMTHLDFLFNHQGWLYYSFSLLTISSSTPNLMIFTNDLPLEYRLVITIISQTLKLNSQAWSTLIRVDCTNTNVKMCPLDALSPQLPLKHLNVAHLMPWSTATSF